MKWIDLLKIVDDQPIFNTGFLTPGESEDQVRLQISRWVNNGRLLKLRKGVYCVAEPYQKKKPDPIVIANVLKKSSYVSLQSALSYYGLIPEYVPVTTSVTTRRPEILITPAGKFSFAHIKTNLFWGYQKIEVSANQSGFIATPEKAFLDLVYLTPHADRVDYLTGLRLQNPELLNMETLREYASKTGSGKLIRAVKLLAKILNKNI